jgi:hypothetical protein
VGDCGGHFKAQLYAYLDVIYKYININMQQNVVMFFIGLLVSNNLPTDTFVHPYTVKKTVKLHIF